MKVLKNNYESNKQENVKKVKSYPRNRICEHCGSELQYDKEDLRIGIYGCYFLDCPCCNQENLIEDESADLTKDNVEFPTHFHHCSVETGAVDACNNERIKESINKAIDFFRENKDEWVWMTATGNLHVVVFKYDDDECYNVVVTNNYYDTYLEFEDEDY